MKKIRMIKVLFLITITSSLFGFISIPNLKNQDYDNMKNLIFPRSQKNSGHIILIDINNTQYESEFSKTEDVIVVFGNNWTYDILKNDNIEYESIIDENLDGKNFTKSNIINSWKDPNDAYILPIYGMLSDFKYLNGGCYILPNDLYDSLLNTQFIKILEKNILFELGQDEVDWGVKKVKAPLVWGDNIESKDVILGNYAGDGIKVGILDTGIDYNHPDLNDNYAGGYDFYDDDSDPMDTYGHGTQCAGIIGAEDSGSYMLGVAPQCELYGLRIVESNQTFSANIIIDAIEWCIEYQIDIISMSFGGKYYSAALEEICSKVYYKGIILISITGNFNEGEIWYPAKFPTVIAVGGIDENEERSIWVDEYGDPAGGSNWGDENEIVAPGTNVKTLDLDQSTIIKNGTSFAAPHVSGVIALMLSANPNLIPDRIREIIRVTATDLFTSEWDQYTGYGLVNAELAMDCIDYPIEYGITSGEEWVFQSESYSYVRFQNTLVYHGDYGYEYYGLYFNHAYDKGASQKVQIDIYSRVYCYVELWNEITMRPLGPCYNWYITPMNMIQWAGDWIEDPNLGSEWSYDVGTTSYKFDYGNSDFSDSWDNDYEAEQTEEDNWRYHGYYSAKFTNAHDVFLKLKVSNDVISDHLDYWYNPPGDIIEHRFMLKIQFMIVLKFKWQWIFWFSGQQHEYVLGDNLEDYDLSEIPIASGNSPA
jgi:hypothetical protein